MNRRAETNRFYAGATGSVLVALAALSITVWWFRPPMLDPVTLCPTDRPIAGHTVVIIDRTDKWNPAIGGALKDLIEAAQRDTKQYEKFSIVSLDAEEMPRPLFSACNPGPPSLLSDLYRGRRYTKRDFDDKFVGAADRVVEAASAPAEAAQSPIVEYVHRWLGRDDFNASVPHRRLVLISDMRQNSAAFDIYKSNIAALAPLVRRQFGAAAKGAVFDVYFVAHGHDHNVSEDEVREAWDRAFKTIPASYDWRQID